jgi:GGDEF domain-containing protein
MRAIEHADQEQEILALLYVDLDNFKSVNDNMNYVIGDLLL